MIQLIRCSDINTSVTYGTGRALKIHFEGFETNKWNGDWSDKQNNIISLPKCKQALHVHVLQDVCSLGQCLKEGDKTFLIAYFWTLCVQGFHIPPLS